ncbi:hypothetical protein QM806_36515 [Rhodococcus sp. IEGM 1351]|uniref:hypothetical protein n=1 Tax=Rhodococcus sp. IEGM 1351 TaxID=3047089 RepID=UPI0024B7B598|nr:hypothetical protein [Rhodococcus sp. IEGM 1351]MDI9940866.1 hypothetical protein [Rhodococcus sp. IEGM 1351]
MSTWWLSQPAPEPPIPTVVIEPQLNLPPEVLDRLAPAPPTGLTQPMATLIGSGVTLLAAIVALGGVLFVQYLTRRNLTSQLDKQQRLHDEEQAEGRRKQAQADRLDALVEAAASLDRMHNGLIGVVSACDRGDAAQLAKSEAELREAFERGSVARLRLKLLRLDESRTDFEAARAVMVTAFGHIRDRSPESGSFMQEAMDASPFIDKAIETFTRAIDYGAQESVGNKDTPSG